MTYAPPGGIGPVAPALFSNLQAPMPDSPKQRHLDKHHLAVGITARRRQLAELESELVAACEAAAAKQAPRAVRLDDRATWDKPMWHRYLAAAARLEPEYGPAMRRLFQEIDQLGRLAELPLAA